MIIMFFLLLFSWLNVIELDMFVILVCLFVEVRLLQQDICDNNWDLCSNGSEGISLCEMNLLCPSLPRFTVFQNECLNTKILALYKVCI